MQEPIRSTVEKVLVPAFYETWWAYTLYVLIAIGILWTMLHLYLQRIKQENNRMLVERERTVSYTHLPSARTFSIGVNLNF